MASGDRSQQATPKRRQDARKRGQVARSRELTGALTGLAVVLLLGWQLPSFVDAWKKMFLHVAARTGAGDAQMMNDASVAVAGVLLRWMAAPFALAWGVAMLASLAQGGIVLSTEPLLPSWHRLDPFANLQNAFSMTAVSRTLKSLVPVTAILFIAFGIARRDWIILASSSRGGARALLAWTAGRLYELAWTCSLVLLAWSVADYGLQRYQLSQSLKMTRQEVIQESKDTAGNPFTKNRIRKRRREARKRWTMKDVERATAIVANPQHLAIALEYRPDTMAAPMVLAKGVNEVALRIKDVGRWNNIPIVENPPLAHALYRAAEVGETIPVKLYAAVAEILAFIYRTQASLRQSAQAAPNRLPPSSGRY